MRKSRGPRRITCKAGYDSALWNILMQQVSNGNKVTIGVDEDGPSLETAPVLPEQALWLRIIYQAWLDATAVNPDGTCMLRRIGLVVTIKETRDALQFFRDGRLRWVCDKIGLNPEWVMQKLVRLSKHMGYDNWPNIEPRRRIYGGGE